MTLFKQTFAVALCAVASTNAIAHDETRHVETIEKTFAVDDNAQLQIENTNGKVEIEAWDRNEVVITASIYSKNAEGRDAVEVLLTQKGNTIDIDTEYKKQSFWNNNNYSKVDYFINVPKSVDLAEVDLTNGSLTITGVAGEVNASLMNGKLVATELASSTYVESHNGSVKLSYSHDLVDLKNIEVDSNNGSITVYLPADIDAKMEAESNNGSIKNDFGLQVRKDRSHSKSLSGEVGSGKTHVNLESNNGSIRIKSL